MKKIIALTTCHNRCNLTLRGLDTLKKQEIPNGFYLNVVLVDDGSVDGTGDAVRKMFPEVNVLNGSGDLFWAGGMRFGWNEFVKQQDFKYLIVFNDDITLYNNAISQLLFSASMLEKSGCKLFAVVGGFKDPSLNATSYGGVVFDSQWHPLRYHKLNPSNTIQDCDTLNMNFALLSKEALNLTGFLSPEFVHAKADFDFGLRLRTSGGRVVLAPGYVGECKNESAVEFNKNDSLRKQWEKLINVKIEPPRERFIFYKRHGGIFWLIFFFLPYFKFCFLFTKIKFQNLS